MLAEQVITIAKRKNEYEQKNRNEGKQPNSRDE